MDWQAITRKDVVNNKLQASFLLGSYLQKCPQSCEMLHMNIQTRCFEVFYKASPLQTSVPLSLLIATAAESYCKEHTESFSFAFSPISRCYFLSARQIQSDKNSTALAMNMENFF